MSQDLLVQLFKYDTESYKTMITGQLTSFLYGRIEVKQEDTGEYIRIDYISICVEKEDATILKIKLDERYDYAISFLCEKSRDCVFDNIKTQENNYISLFSCCKSENEKNAFLEYVIRKNIIDDYIKAEDTENLDFLMVNGSKNIFYELVLRKNELIPLYDKKRTNIKQGLKTHEQNFEIESLKDNTDTKHLDLQANRAKHIEDTNGTHELPSFTRERAIDYDSKFFYQDFIVVYEKVFSHVLQPKKLRCVKSLLDFEKQKKMECVYYTLTDFDSIEVLEFLEFCKDNNKGINIDIISLVLKNRSVEDFANILLYLAKNNTEQTQLYFETHTSYIIFEKLRSHHLLYKAQKNAEKTILSLINSLYFLFDSTSSFYLRNSFYKYVNLLFTTRKEFVFTKKTMRKDYFFFYHEKFYDLLIFMQKNHAYMFDEYWINSGLSFYFMTFTDQNDIALKIFLCRMRNLNQLKMAKPTLLENL